MIPKDTMSGRSLNRRHAMAALVGAGFAARQTPALADIYPSKQITMIVPYAAGGPVDVIARIFSQSLAVELGKPVVVLNRPAGAQTVGLREIAQAPSDGHSLGIVSVAASSAPFLVDSYKLKLDESFELIDQLADGPVIAFVSSSIPGSSVEDFLKYARANPGKLNYAVPTSLAALDIGAFAKVAGLDMVAVSYSSTPQALTAMAVDDVHLAFTSLVSAEPFLQSGKVRPLALASSTPYPSLKVPFLREFVPGYEATPTWFGLLGPKGMPAEVVRRLNEVANRLIASNEVAAKFAQFGIIPRGGPPSVFMATAKSDFERLTQFAELTGIKPQ
jgi:tripartite-type tricarboxylate transporter receptor subunit TctC